MQLKKCQSNQTIDKLKIVLIGFSGTGKTTISRELAKKLQLPLYSTDTLIEKRWGKISSLFSVYGEEYFRNIENKVVEQVVSNRYGIIDCGGGVVEQGQNMSLLREWGTVIWLNCPLELIVERTMDSDRPLLKGKYFTDVKDLYTRRLNMYKEHYDYIVDTSKSLQEITSEIMGICLLL